MILISIIQELFYGNVEPQSSATELSPKLKQQLKNVVKAEEELSAKINDEERALLKKYTDIYNEFCSTSCADAFITGFRIATRIFFDAFSEPN